MSGIILILSKNKLHSLSWWRHCKKNRKKVAFLGTIWPIINIHMQIFLFFHEFYVCMHYTLISICDRGRSVFTFKSRWLSRIHVHFLSMVLEQKHTFWTNLRKKCVGICSTFCQFGSHICQHLLVAKKVKYKLVNVLLYKGSCPCFILIVLIHTDNICTMYIRHD